MVSMFNMQLVTKDQFFASVGQSNVHPRPQTQHTEWVNLRTRVIEGVSTPGYKCEGPESFWVRPGLVKK